MFLDQGRRKSNDRNLGFIQNVGALRMFRKVGRVRPGEPPHNVSTKSARWDRLALPSAGFRRAYESPLRLPMNERDNGTESSPFFWVPAVELAMAHAQPWVWAVRRMCFRRLTQPALTIHSKRTRGRSASGLGQFPRRSIPLALPHREGWDDRVPIYSHSIALRLRCLPSIRQFAGAQKLNRICT